MQQRVATYGMVRSARPAEVTEAPLSPFTSAAGPPAGTFTKAFGSCGGYIAGKRSTIEYLRANSPAHTYACAMAPGCVQQVRPCDIFPRAMCTMPHADTRHVSVQQSSRPRLLLVSPASFPFFPAQVQDRVPECQPQHAYCLTSCCLVDNPASLSAVHQRAARDDGAGRQRSRRAQVQAAARQRQLLPRVSAPPHAAKLGFQGFGLG